MAALDILVLNEATPQIIVPQSGDTYNAPRAFAIAAGTVTTDVNALNITQTWNAGGVTFTGAKWNFTGTAYAAGSNTFDFQFTSASIFKHQPASTGGVFTFTANSPHYQAVTIEPRSTGISTALISGSGAIGINAPYLIGNVLLEKTVTAGGTTGAQTINKSTGTVNFAAAATSLVVTNTLVTANSIIQCTVGTNDATMKSVQAVAAAGSFTIHANAAATAETRVNFLVTN